MNKKLFFQAIIKFIFGVIIISALIFLPAWTINYWNGWLFMGILFIPMFLAGIIMMIKNPELLKKRLNAKEEEIEQKQVIALSGLMFLAGFIVAGLNFRFGWIVLPDAVPIISAVVFLIAYILYAEVLRENTYLSRTIEVQENQKVVDTRVIWNSKTSNVCSNDIAIFINAISFRFGYFIYNIPSLSNFNSKKNKK